MPDIAKLLSPRTIAVVGASSDLQGLDNLSPKFSIPVEVAGRRYILTGILPKNEFQAKAAWGGAGIFSRPIGCGASVGMMGSTDKKTLARKRVIETWRTTKSWWGPMLLCS